MKTDTKQVSDSTDVTNDDYADYEYRFEYLKAVAAGHILAQGLSSAIRFWTHEPYQPLIGKILGFDSFEHSRYGTQQTVIVEREDGEAVSAILTPYLQEGMKRQNGEIGDLVLIKKEGQDVSKNGKIFNNFLFIVDKK